MGEEMNEIGRKSGKNKNYHLNEYRFSQLE